jgi:hypothetical protein
MMLSTSDLRRLDPARAIPDSLVEAPRARSVLAEITSAPPGQGAPVQRRRSSTALRVAAGIAAASIGVLALTQIVNPSSAYASWTAVPRPATGTEVDRWGSWCLDMHAEGTHQGYEVRLVEARGPYAYVVLGGSQGYEATCLFQEKGDGNHEASGFSAPLPQQPPRDGLVTNSVRAVADDGNKSAFEVTGRAGPDVASVVFDIDGIQVSATLDNGYFAAWWPAATSLIPRWGPPNPNVTITLKDGTSHTQRIQTYDVSPL